MLLRQKIGVMIGNTKGWDASTADAFCKLWAANGGGYILVQSTNGAERLPVEKITIWKQACAKYGPVFGIWVVTYTDPEGDALRTAQDIGAYKPQLLSVNAEAYYRAEPWKYIENSVEWGNEMIRWRRSAQFVTQLLRSVADAGLSLPSERGLSTLGSAGSGAHPHPMDIQVWRDAGFHIHAQAYYNAFEVYRPDYCIASALKSGFKPEEIVLTLGCYQGESPSQGGKGLHLHVPDYLPLLSGLKFGGANLFIAESLDGFDFNAISSLQQIVMPAPLPYEPPPAPPPSGPVGAETKQKMIDLAGAQIHYWRKVLGYGWNTVTPGTGQKEPIKKTKIYKAANQLDSTQFLL
jgi:hypothetical protein